MLFIIKAPNYNTNQCICHKSSREPEAGVFKVNPVAGFWANTLDPNPSVAVVLEAAGVDVGAPNPPNANPPVPAAGVLVKISDITSHICITNITPKDVKDICTFTIFYIF